jgi:para-nitrobenzyl esterase
MLAGQSMGGTSVVTLMSMLRAAGLFRRAIVQSGAPNPVLATSTAFKVASYLADGPGVDPTRSALAQVPIRNLLEVQTALSMELATAPDPGRWGELALNMLPFEPGARRRHPDNIAS